jgi:acetyl-CoA C-acetyltransferase/acetyl-CoA acyltransferase
LEDGNVDVHDVDEGIRFDASLEAMQSLNTLREGGVITAGTASQISDGAAAIMVANEEAVKKYKLPVRAKIQSLAVIGSDPVIMLEGPIPATKKALEKAGLSIDDIDLYEVNEAFGSVPLAWAKALNADMNKLNVNGGAQALGHPLGGTGAKLMTTLVHELERREAKYGLVAICEGGGTANAMIIERMSSISA